MVRQRFKRYAFCALLAIPFAGKADGLEPVLTAAAEITRTEFWESTVSNALSFRFSGQVTYLRDAPDGNSCILIAEDVSGGALLSCATSLPGVDRLTPGVHAEFAGSVRQRTVDGYGASVTSIKILDQGIAPPPIEAEVSDILDGKFDLRRIRFSGTLRDVAVSETAPHWLILVVYGRKERIYVSVPASDGSRGRLDRIIGSHISVLGTCVPFDPSVRQRTGRTFKVASADDIHADTPTPSDLNAPDISTIQFTRPEEVLALGWHSVTGRVIAVWQNQHALLKTSDGDIVGLDLSGNPPRYGQRILAVGLPESDLLRINLTDVTWRDLPPSAEEPDLPTAVTPQMILPKRDGFELIESKYHGNPITLVGTIRNVSSDESQRFHADCNGHLVTIDASACPEATGGLSVGCRISASGTCVIESEYRHQSSVFPQMKGFFLVLRTPADVTILAHPPWWTTGRLISIIGTLFAILVGILIWNTTLRRLASRKGRELMREQLGHVKAELKTEERTRLAVELHDSLAQNLTGIALEIDTAAKITDENRDAMMAHLGIAARTLKSCRDELRNCLWDLRNRALEENTMDAAIRRTLSPHIAGVELAIRFNVPRARISDNTAHAILRIIRELTLNGIRHGKATKIWIAGSLDGTKLKFSVRDNGSGFNPEEAPGFSLGHYGLLGIRERIEAFEGEFRIDSTPGKGTKATIAILAPQEEDDK